LARVEAPASPRPIDWSRVLDDEFGKHDVAGNVRDILYEEKPSFIQY